MKKYNTPEIKINNILKKDIASLNDWLNSNDFSDAGITTYVVNS